MLYAWPSHTAVDKLKFGQKVQTKLLTQTTSDSLGQFSLAAPDASRLTASYVNSAGTVNLDVVSITASGTNNYAGKSYQVVAK